jgi:hypothetical protein
MFLALLVSSVTAMNLIDKIMLLKDTPRCSIVCNAQTCKKIGVSYLHGAGNCARPQFLDEWRQCVKVKCSKRDSRKVVDPQFINNRLC